MNTFSNSKKRLLALFISTLLFCLVAIVPINKVYAAEVNSIMYYNIYDSDGYYNGSYSLSASPTLSTSNSRGVIGTDNRVVDFTKSGVVKIITSAGMGTGFVVDSHTIATAAHCAYSKSSAESDFIAVCKFQKSYYLMVLEPLL